MTCWTKRWAFGVLLVVAGGCEVHTGDDPDFEGFGGTGGTRSTGGTSSTAGRGGSAGTGTGGSGGSMSMVNGGSGGTGGADNFPAPVCSAEAGDDADPCIQCVKAECCTAWRGCDDQTCFQEWEDVRVCMESIVFPTDDDFYECSSESADDVDSMLVQSNTNTLLGCVMETVEDADSGVSSARCGQVCLGLDILLTQ